MSSAAVEVASRLERLPLSRWHKTIVALLAGALVFEYMDLYSFAFTPALMEHEGFTVQDVAIITGATAAGTFFGAGIGGRLADRFGRKPVLLACVATYSLGSLLNAVVADPIYFLALRFVTALGFQGMNVVTVVLLAELMPARVRGRAQAWAVGCGAVGPMVMAWLGFFVVPNIEWGWRLLYVVGGLGIVLFVVLQRHLPESPRWLVSAGHHVRAETTLRAIEDEITRQGHVLPPPDAAPTPPAEDDDSGAGLRALAKAGYGGRFAVTSAIFTLGVVSYFGFNYWVSTLLKLRGFDLHHTTLYTAIIVTVGMLGPLAATFFADRWQRKHILAGIGAALGILSLLFTLASSTVAAITLACVLSFVFQLSVPLTLTYTSEVFPTRFRSTGLGWANSIARVANVIAAQVISALLLGFGIAAVFYFVAALMFTFALLISVFGIRTRGISLEEVNEARAETTPTAS
ncbi:MFS transporter [Streptomyces sp. LHD-70]|uniref:MFS transporter n=1 Tax=Streptomyces sp. LHD-70 TaxID=3072140 RepID=UPI00280FC98E|nr:MFS transporter [Streptomyces sp. LHD-70]MDQ8706152.1 MFS transporter [Streptomyces sp. LHD-70]